MVVRGRRVCGPRQPTSSEAMYEAFYRFGLSVRCRIVIVRSLSLWSELQLRLLQKSADEMSPSRRKDSAFCFR